MAARQGSPGHWNFSSLLLGSMISLILIIGIGLTAYDYITIRETYQKHADFLEKQTEDNLIESFQILDTGFRLYDDSLNGQMKNSFLLFLDEYKLAGYEPARMNLTRVKGQLGSAYDLYIINESGIIEYTTYPPEQGFDFKEIPYFAEYLNRIRQSEGFFPDRVVNEYSTGILRKYAYMPSPDHRFIFELGFIEPASEPKRSLQPYKDNLDKIAYLNPYVTGITIYDVESHLVANFSQVATPDLKPVLATVISKRNGTELFDPKSGLKTTFLFIDLKDEAYGSDVSRIVQITYDTMLINRELDNMLLSRLITGTIAISLSILIAVLLSRFLNEPIRTIVKDAKAIAQGSLHHTISSPRLREFAILSDHLNRMVGTLKTMIAKERQSEERFRHLVTITSDLVWEFDELCILRYISPKTERIIGYRPEDLLGHPIAELLVQRESEYIPDGIRNAIETRSPFSFEQIPILHKDSRIVILETSGIPIYNPDGTFCGYRGISRDISLREQSEEQLKTLYNELELRVEQRTADLKRAEEATRLANLKLNLLSSVTRHDVRNALTVIAGYIDIAERSGDSVRQKEFLDKARESVKKIQKHLSFTKEYEELGIRSPAWQNIGDLVTKVCNTLDCSILELAPLISRIEIFADPLLEKVVFNLLENALRHGGKKLTRIYLSAEESGNYLVITCEDNGAGISAENKEQIFDREFGNNTGLGLFLTRKILAITGISIAETGEPGNGARFEIKVPSGTFRYSAEDV